MKAEPFLIIVYLVPIIGIALGIAQIIFARRFYRWAATVFWPLFFRLLDWLIFNRLERLLGLESGHEDAQSSSRSKEPSPTQIMLTRIAGVGYIVMGVIFLAAVLGVFR